MYDYRVIAICMTIELYSYGFACLYVYHLIYATLAWTPSICKKSLMFKYSRMQKKISPWLVCGSRGACLDSMLPGVQVTAGVIFSVFKSFKC